MLDFFLSNKGEKVEKGEVLFGQKQKNKYMS